MGDIVSLPNAAPRIWVCDCGSQSFRLYEDGVTECCSCWAKDFGNGHLYAFPPGAVEGSEPTIMITDGAAASFEKASVVAAARAADALAILVICADGRAVSYREDMDVVRVRWLSQRVREAVELFRSRAEKAAEDAHGG